MEIYLNSIEKSPRESNFELLRIFAMLAIIAHHFVVNSGVEQLMNYANPQTNDCILAVYGAWLGGRLLSIRSFLSAVISCVKVK